MNDQEPEILDLSIGGPPRRRWALVLVAVLVVAVGGILAVPRLLDDSSPAKPHRPASDQRKLLLRELGDENVARTDAEEVSRRVEFAFAKNNKYPADLDEVVHFMGGAIVASLDADDSVRWYFRNSQDDFVFCVEHRRSGKPDAYALYGSTLASVGHTDHGQGCPATPADYAAAAFIVGGQSSDAAAP